jgi:flagellar basal-body rod modification protein FlgD
MASTGFTAELGRNQFLQLFATQLQNQDPLEPVGQQEFLQQLAQFSTVEGIENMNSQFRGLGTQLDTLIDASKGDADLARLQAINAGSGLLGKSVRFGNGTGDVGVVSEVVPDAGQILMRVGDTLIPVSSVISVANPDPGSI